MSREDKSFSTRQKKAIEAEQRFIKQYKSEGWYIYEYGIHMAEKDNNKFWKLPKIIQKTPDFICWKPDNFKKPIFVEGKKENLEVDSEANPPVIQYSGIVRNTETKIPISGIKVREDGIGYKGAHKFDMVLEPSFAKRVKSTSDSLYGDQEELPYPIGITEPRTREPVGN